MCRALSTWPENGPVQGAQLLCLRGVDFEDACHRVYKRYIVVRMSAPQL